MKTVSHKEGYEFPEEKGHLINTLQMDFWKKIQTTQVKEKGERGILQVSWEGWRTVSLQSTKTQKGYGQHSFNKRGEKKYFRNSENTNWFLVSHTPHKSKFRVTDPQCFQIHNISTTFTFNSYAPFLREFLKDELHANKRIKQKREPRSAGDKGSLD